MIIVAIGANLPGKQGQKPLAACQQAVQALQDYAHIDVKNIAKWYKTDPIDCPPGSPVYVNGAVEIETDLNPQALLAALLEIEKQFGRVRTIKNAARELDLDILDYNGQVIDEAPDLIIPHPRLHLRAFTLYPMRDLAPDWQHPVLGESIKALIAKLPDDQGIEVI